MIFSPEREAVHAWAAIPPILAAAPPATKIGTDYWLAKQSLISGIGNKNISGILLIYFSHFIVIVIMLCWVILNFDETY